jgi:hypothetical protein
MKLFIVLISIFGVVVIAFNLKATRLVLRSEIHNRFQKAAQILFVWLIPLVGAIVTKEIHIAKYIQSKEPWAEHGYHGQGDGGGDAIHLPD